MIERQNSSKGGVPDSRKRTVIRLSRVSKHYYSREKKGNLIKAVDAVSLEIESGTITGLVGKNGCGKSTLLKMIAGITKPTKGTIEVFGSLLAFTDFGAGFHPDLSGNDNVYLVGGLYGLTKSDVALLLPEIVEFSELKGFMEMPVKNYSQGMFLRLAFSLMIHLPLQVVLLDEALAVGDEAFRQKCYEKIRVLVENGLTILLVSHSYHEIAGLCERCIVMEDGKVVRDGSPAESYNSYVDSIAIASQPEVQNKEERDSTFDILKPGYINILSVQLSNQNNPKADVDFTNPVVVSIEWEKLVPEGTIYFDLMLLDKMGIPFLSTSNYYGKRIDLTKEVNTGDVGRYITNCIIPSSFLNHGLLKVGVNATVFFERNKHHSLIITKRPISVLIKNPEQHSEEFFWFENPAPIRTVLTWKEEKIT